MKTKIEKIARKLYHDGRLDAIDFRIEDTDKIHQATEEILKVIREGLPKEREEMTTDGNRMGTRYRYTKDGVRYYSIEANEDYNEAIQEMRGKCE
jgi:hypothetical protein